MPKGGARVRSGPPTNPGALRRRPGDGGEWTVLPAEGRAGDPPAWPLGPNPGARAMNLWAALWVTPQAIMWEQGHQEIEVALHVLTLVDAEQPGAPAAVRTLARQQMDSLGLTTPGMRASRWRIAHDDDGQPSPVQSGSSSKSRVKIASE